MSLHCLIALAPSGYGQAVGSFSGTVTDKSGSTISGATVRAISEATGISREVKTDEVGHYLIPLLPPANYTVHVEFSGFQTTEQRGVKLQVDEARTLDFSLAPAAVSSQIEVEAAAVAVETTNPSLGQVITGQQVAQLPLNGRDFVQLASLTPGTVQETNPNSFFTSGADSEVAARGSFSLVGWRFAAERDGLAAGRRGQQRADVGRHRNFLGDRLDSGIQGSDLQLFRGIRNARGTNGVGDDEVRVRTIFTARCLNFFATLRSTRRASLRLHLKSST